MILTDILANLFQPRNELPVSHGSRSGLSLFAPSTGHESSLAAMGRSSTVYSIVTKIANGLSRVDWDLWRKASTGDEDERERVTMHAALDLWDQPNEFMSRQEFVETTGQYQELCGEQWWVIGRSPLSPLPLEIWPIAPHRMQPVKHPTRFIVGYVYTSPDGEKIPLERDQVIFLKAPNPNDPYRGLGPIQSISLDIETARYAAEWGRNYFINGAVPGGVIEVPETLSEADFDRLQRHWQESHKGVDNAHRVGILEKGTYKALGATLKDMEFTTLRTETREIIREAFGIHKTVLGISDDVNRANADAGRAAFGEDVLVPRLERIKGGLNRLLLPLYGKGTNRLVEFDYRDPVPPDHEQGRADMVAKSQTVAAYVQAGFEPADVLTTVGVPLMRHTGLPPTTPPIV